MLDNATLMLADPSLERILVMLKHAYLALRSGQFLCLSSQHYIQSFELLTQ